MPDRIRQLLARVLTLIAFEVLVVLVHIPRNNIEIESLCRFWLAIHEQRQALRACIAQPFLDRQPVAFRFGYLLTVLVEEQFIDKTLRRDATERAANLSREFR